VEQELLNVKDGTWKDVSRQYCVQTRKECCFESSALFNLENEIIMDPCPSSTITMSVYFHATQEEMEDVADDFVLTQASGTRAVQSTARCKRNYRAQKVRY
jgi:hypothetical protein